MTIEIEDLPIDSMVMFHSYVGLPGRVDSDKLLSISLKGGRRIPVYR
jgi:hypothetical protein